MTKETYPVGQDAGKGRGHAAEEIEHGVSLSHLVCVVLTREDKRLIYIATYTVCTTC